MGYIELLRLRSTLLILVKVEVRDLESGRELCVRGVRSTRESNPISRSLLARSGKRVNGLEKKLKGVAEKAFSH